MVRQILTEVEPKMAKAVEHFEQELRSLRSGRASTALVEGVAVEMYGQTLPLKQVATIAAPDYRTIAITPWDKSAIASIEKAIRDNKALGLNPSNDGSTVRVNIPPLTEERRREIVKQLGEKTEACHIALRNVRHEALSDARKLEKQKQATQDDLKWAESELNKKMEQYRAQVTQLEKAKAQEIMEL
jgi:ribosome recycling factor